MKIGNQGATRSTSPDFPAALNDPVQMEQKRMTDAPSYDRAVHDKPTGIDVNTATAFHNKILAAIAVYNAQESRTTGTELWWHGKEMKSESVIAQ